VSDPFPTIRDSLDRDLPRHEYATTRDVPGPQPPPTRRDADGGTGTRGAAGAGPASGPGRAAPADGARAGLPDELFARYEPVGTLPEGGEAQRVVLVRERDSETMRVVKLYSTALRPDPALIAALQRADPAHVVRILGSGTATDTFGFTTCWEVMEYVERGSLRKLLNDERRQLPPERVREIVRALAGTLTYLHTSLAVGGSVGVAHRDVKPENILVRELSPISVVLCDFGLVAEIRATRIFSRAAGTLAYQAPETWYRKSPAPSQDWWSLGVMTVEMLTGRNPNSGVGGEPLDEDDLRENITARGVDLTGITEPRWLALCRGLLHRAPEHRWGADEVAAWLDGDDPDVAADHGRVDLGFRAPASIPPFELAGRRCANPTEVGVAMADDTTIAEALFRNRDRRLDLSDWLRDHFPEAKVPTDLMRTDATTDAEAALRVARFISYVASDMPPRFGGRPTDAQGIANICRQAIAGDVGARRFVDHLDQTLLRTFAEHRCRVHPDCNGGGCAVLDRAADQLSIVEAEFFDRVTMLCADEARTGAGPAIDGAMRDLRPTVRPALLLGLVDTGYLAELRGQVRGAKHAARCAWWRPLRDEATSRQAVPPPLVPLTLAALLAGTATAQAVTAEAERRRVSDVDNQRRVRWQQFRRGAARGVLGDLLSLTIALALACLTTYLAYAVYYTATLKVPQTLTPLQQAQLVATVAGGTASAQGILALPVLVLFAALLLRPNRPAAAAAAICWLSFGGGLALVWALLSHHPAAVTFPIVAPHLAHDQLLWLDRIPGRWFAPVGLFVLLPLSVVLARWLVRRARAAALGDLPWQVNAVRIMLVAVIAGLYAVRLAAVLWNFPVPGLPTKEFWVVL
jgi:hypothetical protein